MASKQSLLRVLALAGAGLTLACSSAPSTPTISTGAEAPRETTVAPPAPPLPDRLDDLTVLAPRQVSWAASLPNLDGVRSHLDPALVQTVEHGAAEGLSDALGLPKEVALRVIGAYDGCFAFGGIGGVERGAIAVRLRDPSILEPLVAAAKLEPKGPDRWTSSFLEVAWLAKAKVAIIASEPKILDATLDRARGIGRDFASSPLYQARKPGDLWLSVDLARVVPERDRGTYEQGSKILAWFDPADGLHVEHANIGNMVPSLGAIIAPSPLTSVAGLPSGAVVAYGFSIKRAPGKGTTQLIEELARGFGPGLPGGVGAEAFEAQLTGLLGVDAPTLDRAVGDEVAFGVYLADKKPAKASGPHPKLSPEERGVVVGRIAMRDPAVSKRVVDAIGGFFKGDKSFKKRAGGFTMAKPNATFEVDVHENEILLVGGAKALVPRLKTEARASSKRLADDTGFTAARARSPREVHALLFADFDRVNEVFDNLSPMTTPRDIDLMLTATLKGSTRGLEGSYLATASNPTTGVAAGVGVAAALAIYGVQTYLGSAKASEAKNTVGAIARAVAASYEREQPAGKHSICGAAIAVPSSVPKGTRYVPSDAPGKDFETGTDAGGWRCLRFTMTTPHYYQYEYRVGQGYKGPARGGPNPGPNGFEISAEGDLDGDGKTSLFILTGKVDPKKKTVTIDPDLFIVDERE